MKKYSTQYWCITAMGIALFVALSMVIRFPIFQNYYLCLGYIAMAIWLYSVDTLSGTLVGVCGTVLYCLSTGMLHGLPGWAIGNIVIGFYLGFAFKIIKCMNNKVGRAVIVALSIVVSTALGILIVKSGVEWIIYAEPFVIRIAKNMYALVADIVVLLIAYPICMIVDPLLDIKLTKRGHSSH